MMCPVSVAPISVKGCPVAWVPILVVGTPQFSGHVTPSVVVSGCVTPCAQPPLTQSASCQAAVCCGRLQLPAKQAGLDFSAASTAMPSAGCSETASEVDEDDLAEAMSELMEQLEAGGAARDAALEALEGGVQDLAFDPSCRVVQKALECADVEVAASLVLELTGRVVEATKCPHANHVLQRALDLLPAPCTEFIVAELVGAGVEVARHKYGCRVLSRVVKVHFGKHQTTSCERLAEELLQEAAELSRHNFAHYVIESILEHGSIDQSHVVSVHLRMDLLANARHRSATYVVEKALKFCDAHDQEAMVSELFGSVQAVTDLVGNQFGCHIAKSLVRMHGDPFDHVLAILPKAAPFLQKTKYGRRVLAEFRNSES